MVFVRNVVSRLVRPAVMSRYMLVPKSATNASSATSIAAFPSFVPCRSIHGSMEKETKSAINPSFSAAEDGINFSSHTGLENSLDGVKISNEQPSEDCISTEALLEKFQTLMKQAKTLGSSSTALPINELEEIFKELSNKRDFASCHQLIKEMREAGIKPSSNMYSWVLRAGRRALRAREIRVLFGEETRRDMEEALNGIKEEPSAVFEPMKEMLEMMKEDGAEPTDFFYDDMAFGLATANISGLLINLAVTMEKRGRQPTTYYYNKMLYSLPRSGLSDRADVLFSRMVLNNLADQTSYIVRIGSLVYLQRIKDAEHCFKDMNKLYGLNEIACNTIIHGYLNNRDVDSAMGVLEMMKLSDDSNCRPSTVTANTFVAYYTNTGDLLTAPAILEYFASSIGFPISTRDHAAMFKLFSRNDQQRALKIIEIAKEKPGAIDAEMYNAVIACLLDRIVPLSFRNKVASIMVPDNVPIAGESLAALCISCSPEIRQLVAKMEKENIPMTSFTFELILRALRSRRDHDAAVQVYRRIPLSLQNHSHRNMFLASIIQKGEAEEIKGVVKDMNERRHIIYDYNNESLTQLGIDSGRAGRMISKKYNSNGSNNHHHHHNNNNSGNANTPSSSYNRQTSQPIPFQ